MLKTRNIHTTKFSKIHINKKNTFKISKSLLGLLAVSLCFRAGFGCSQRAYQQKKEASATMGVLVDREIIAGKNNKNHVIFWLDTDGNRQTIEGFCNMPAADQNETAKIASLTNGTTKSLAEWRRFAHPHEVQHNPCDFLSSR